MPTLNDILTANGDYTPVSGYPVDDKYENDSPVINVYDRTIGEIVGDTSTSGENVSQYLTFRIPRHPDHYDLIENGTNIRILYRLEDDTGEDVVPVNVVANEDYIIFGWKIPLVVTVNPGVVTFIIHAYKSENNIITYHYKTLPKTYMILETMETDVVVPEIEMYNLAEAYARGTITDVFGHTRPVEEGEPGYHDNSKYYKELAGTSKIDAETAKNAAEAAQEAAETAQQAAEDARDQAVAIVGGEYVSYGQTQSLNDTQKNKARENIEATGPNGYYPNMTVGLSENFVGTGEPTRRIFNYDTAGGSADISDGNAEIDKIVGGTVAWNQLVQGGNFTEASSWATSNATMTVSNNIGTVTQNNSSGYINKIVNTVSGHKCLATLDIKGVAGKLYTFNGVLVDLVADGTWQTRIGIFTATAARTYLVVGQKGEDGFPAEWQIRNACIFDLTQMFGSTIADYIYSLEQSQAGAGVAWFKKLFPLDYYPYDEGTLLNVNPAGIKTVGFNAYDKTTGKAELIGGNQYQITGTYTSLSYSTGEVLTPDSTGCFTPTKTGELTVTGGGENTCVHLTWSGYRNGDYEDYWTRTRDINVQPYFPDGLKRAGTVYDEISKDKAIKRIGVVDLGTLNWTRSNNNGTWSNYLFFTQISGMKNNANQLICAKYLFDKNNPYSLLTDKNMQVSSNYLYIRDDSYTDKNAFATAMSGVMLYYELDTPIETKIDPPLNLLYQVSDFGTEQFLGAGATEPKTLPIIADIVYNVNYRDTIKNLPKNYAKVRGYYPDLYTGLADNLIDRKGNGTPQEISYRTSCGDDSIADDGNGIIQSILGKTVVWNQLIKNGDFSDGKTHWGGDGASLEVADGVVAVTVLALTYSQGLYQGGIPVSNGHKYLLSADFNFPYSNVTVSYRVGLVMGVWSGQSGTANTWCTLSTIRSATADSASEAFELDVHAGTQFSANDVYYVRKCYAIDLTQMFGAGNEPSTLDDPRIKWIKDYANEYPEYNIGELISYNGSGIKTVGFNQWDEEWVNGTYGNNGELVSTLKYICSKNKIKVLPSTTYYIKAPVNMEIVGYGADKEYIKRIAMSLREGTFTTASNMHYITFGSKTVDQLTTYNHDICINLSWSGYRNGEYEPYWSRTLNLPISTYFPDGMKSAGSVKDELTKDKAVKRIGVVDLGTLSWDVLVQGEDHQRFKAVSTQFLKGGNCICDKLLSVVYNDMYNHVVDNSIAIHPNAQQVEVYASAYTDATAFKTAMSGVMLYYELAEPIETTITPPLDLTYKVADFGTEESIAEGKSTPFNGIIKYSDDFTRGLVNMPKNYDTTASLDALAASLSAMLTSALDGTVTITRGAYDPATKKYEWNCQFTKNQSN